MQDGNGRMCTSTWLSTFVKRGGGRGRVEGGRLCVCALCVSNLGGLNVADVEWLSSAVFGHGVCCSSSSLFRLTT